MENNKVSFKEKLGIAFGYAGGSELYIIMSAFLVYFYTNVIGLNAGIVGTIILISKVFDGISDILFGSVIDKTRTKFGVCRPWIIAMAFCDTLAIVTLFTVPNISGIGKIVYVFLSYNFSNTIIYTIQLLAVSSLPTYVTRDNKEQASMYVLGNIGQYIMQVLITTFFFKLVSNFGGTQMAWVKVSIIMAIIATVFLLILAVLSKERINPDEIVKNQEKVRFIEILKAILQNKYWFEILAFVILGSGIYAITSTMTTYYSEYILNDTNLIGTLNACYTLPMMIISPLFILFVKKFSKRDIALIGVVIQTIGTLIIIAMPTNIIALCGGAILKSIGFSGPNTVFMAMLADTIEYGQWKTGVRGQAILMGANGCGQKIGSGLVSALLGYVMAFAGFDGLKEVQSSQTLSAISSLYMYWPFALSAIMVIILFCYNLDKIYPQIRADLEEREKRSII